jgi:hypothetical protein
LTTPHRITSPKLSATRCSNSDLPNDGDDLFAITSPPGPDQGNVGKQAGRQHHLNNDIQPAFGARAAPDSLA